mgnify:CR=1 FL=1
MIRPIAIIFLLICLLLVPGCGGVNNDIAPNYKLGDGPDGEDTIIDVPAVDGDGKLEEIVAEPSLEPAAPSPKGEREGQSLGIEKTGEVLSLGPFSGILPQVEWSPLGESLAISGYSDGFGIWLFDLKEEKAWRALRVPTQETLDYVNLQLLGWSPGGKELYYSIDGLQTTGSYLGLSGTLVGQIGAAEGEMKELAWFPARGRGDMTQLKLTGKGDLLVHQHGDIWRLDLASGRKKLVVGGIPQGNSPFKVFFSPTGRYGVYQDTDSTGNGLILIDTKTGKSSPIISDENYHFFPLWGPTDEKLAFLTGVKLEDGYDLFVGEDGALPPATLIQVFDLKNKTLTPYRVPDGQVGAPMWSPDGKYLTFFSAKWEKVLNPYGPDFRWEGLWELEAESGKLQLLSPVQGEWFSLADWSPDGDEVYIYRYEADGSSSLQVVDRRKRRIKHTIQEAIDEPILWYKGNLIIGRVLEEPRKGELYTEIYLVDQGGRTSQLTNNGGWKNGFQTWADRLSYVRGDATASSYLLYVELVSLP